MCEDVTAGLLTAATDEQTPHALTMAHKAALKISGGTIPDDVEEEKRQTAEQYVSSGPTCHSPENTDPQKNVGTENITVMTPGHRVTGPSSCL